MGFVISRKLSMRLRFLQQYLQFVSYIETEIRYSQRILSEIINEYKNESEFQFFLTEIKENLKSRASFSKAWTDSVHKIPNSYGLLRQEKELISEFGQELGSTDIDGQIALCNLNRSLINSILDAAKEEKTKKSKLYFMLGTSFGICIAVILL